MLHSLFVRKYSQYILKCSDIHSYSKYVLSVLHVLSLFSLCKLCVENILMFKYSVCSNILTQSTKSDSTKSCVQNVHTEMSDIPRVSRVCGISTIMYNEVKLPGEQPKQLRRKMEQEALVYSVFIKNVKRISIV